MRIAFLFLCISLTIFVAADEEDEKCSKNKLVFAMDLEARRFHRGLGPVNYCTFKIEKNRPEFAEDPYFKCLHHSSPVKSMDEIRRMPFWKKYNYQKILLTCFNVIQDCELLEKLYHCSLLHAAEE